MAFTPTFELVAGPRNHSLQIRVLLHIALLSFTVLCPLFLISLQPSLLLSFLSVIQILSLLLIPISIILITLQAIKHYRHQHARQFLFTSFDWSEQYFPREHASSADLMLDILKRHGLIAADLVQDPEQTVRLLVRAEFEEKGVRKGREVDRLLRLKDFDTSWKGPGAVKELLGGLTGAGPTGK